MEKYKCCFKQKCKKNSFLEKILINDALCDDKRKIACAFNEYFTNIGPKLANSIEATNLENSFEMFLPNTNISSTFSFSLVTYEITKSTIKSLKPKTSSGYDNISTKLLKEISDEIAEPLTLIINQTLTSSIFPDSLKLAQVSPIHKKGDETLLNNYRPISLLPAISKVIEQIIHSQLSSYFVNKELLYSSQYGFRKHHSTEDAAVELVDRILNYMESDCIPFAIFLDLSKAFDTLDHDIILFKLKHYGLSIPACNLLKNYLSNRKQFVSLNGFSSDYD